MVKSDPDEMSSTASAKCGTAFGRPSSPALGRRPSSLTAESLWDPETEMSVQRIEKMKNADEEEFIDAFELISRVISMTRDIHHFVVNCPKDAALDILKDIVREYTINVQEGRCRHSLILTVQLPLNDIVCGRLDIMQAGADWIVVTGSRMLGSPNGFRCVLGLIEESLTHFAGSR
jgi:hypothetical protein